MRSEAFLRWFLGIFVVAAGLAAFGLTVAPTLSFWDCGEFIACSAILGIPHPPGAPLYVEIGRVFTLLPIGEDIGYRVNLISVISSAFTGLMGFLIILKLFELWWPGVPSRFWKYLAAVSGALCLDFSSTFWSSAVEAEVYGFSMFLMLGLMYLTLLWYDERFSITDRNADYKKSNPDRYLILISYLGLLSVGVHMTVFLIMPIIFAFILYADPEKRRDFRFWITAGSLLIVLGVVEPFLIAAVVWTLISGLVYFTNGKTNAWRLAFLMTLFGLVGFSDQLYIPIRSAQDPAIDENNPNNWGTFKAFLERKQYGQENMLTRMSTRRAKWSSQFGRHPRMGFWGFFEEQYGKGGWAFMPVFLLGLTGLLVPLRKDKKSALFMLAVVLAGTIGLVLYMNFADGTRMDRYGEAGLEVRDRDYFWTPGFVTFALAIGIGIGILGMLLSSEEIRQRLKAPLRLALSGFLILLAIAIPTLELKANFVRNSRAGNYLPYDYAYNLLSSCDRNALIFTNGDNDTFPLWCLQEAYGVRKDVRVINLSLLNTGWYILQLKNKMGVPISLADSQIEMHDLPLPNGLIASRPLYPYFDKRRGMSHYLMTFQLDKEVVRVQDFMMEDIATANDWKYPLYVSRTVPANSRVGLDNHLQAEGMVLRLVPQTGQSMYDIEKSEKFLWETYRYRNFATPDVTMDDNETGMMVAFPELAIELFNLYLQKGDTARAITQLGNAVERFPFYPRSLLTLYEFYQARGQLDKARKLAEGPRKFLERAVRRSPSNPLWWLFLSNAHQIVDQKGEAYRAIRKAWEINPSEEYTFQTYLRYCLVDNKTAEAVQLAREWLEEHPNDAFALQVVGQYGSGFSAPPPTPAPR